MKTLSAALEAAAKADSHTPAVRVRLYNQRPNLPRYQFTSIYAGLETDNYNAACFAGDGSLNRARIQSGAPNYSAYHSRVTTPGPGSDFTSWTLVDVVSTASKVALAVYGATVMLFTLNVDGLTLQVKTSTDNGATWGAWVSIFTCAVTPGHIAAAFNADGSICMLFFDEGNTIKTAKYEAAAWGAPAAWTNTLTAINGISAIFDAAWRLAFAGTDGSSNEGVWICSYTTAYAWTALLNVITASPGAAIKFWFPSLDKPSSFNMIFMEDFSGTEAYSQMRLTAEAASSVFADNLWTEPAVFNNYGKTIFTLLHNTVYLWIVRQNRILIAPTDSNMQDISANLQNVEAITTPRDGSVAVELRNDIKQYNSPILGIGAQLEVEWGYQTTSGALFASVSTYWIERLEYRREAYKSTLVIHALDAWGVLKKLRARYQYVWAAGATSIEDILKWLLARAGLSYTTVSASSTITGQTPPFTLYANETYANAIIRLLQKVPDVIYFRAATARAVNPASGDASVYAYGGAHAILEGRYITEALGVNSVIVIGDAITTYDWEVTEAAASGERVFQVYDKSLTTAALAHQRGAAEESRAARERASGIVTVPLQPAQELYDVIDVTDSLLGLSASRRRVAGLKHRYNTRKGEYSLTMQLSNVFYTFAP